jgi:hypothetical protein
MDGEQDPTKHHMLHSKREWMRTERSTRLRRMSLWIIRDIPRDMHNYIHVCSNPLYVPQRRVLKDFEEMSHAVVPYTNQLDAEQLVVADLLSEAATSTSELYAEGAFWLAHGIHEQIAVLRQLNWGE